MEDNLVMENMTRKEIIKTLVNDYGHNEFDLKGKHEENLRKTLEQEKNDAKNDSDPFPNNDENDGSHSWD